MVLQKLFEYYYSNKLLELKIVRMDSYSNGKLIERKIVRFNTPTITDSFVASYV